MQVTLTKYNLHVCPPRDARTITDTGFQFLMCDSHRQLWTFLGQYITETAAASSAVKQEDTSRANHFFICPVALQ